MRELGQRKRTLVVAGYRQTGDPEPICCDFRGIKLRKAACLTVCCLMVACRIARLLQRHQNCTDIIRALA